MVDDYAQNVQAWLESRFSVKVPIVKRAPAAGETAIVVGGYVAGDIYQGGTSDDTVTLVHFTRPDSKQPLAISLNYAVHEESGMVDRWQCSVSGALDSERDSLLAALKPTSRLRMMFNDNMTPRVTFNDEPVAV